VRTITINKGGGKFSPGWHTVAVSKAVYGDYNGTKYIDIWFKDYPDNLNMRVYAKQSKEGGEEFAIGNVFRFANAGITEVLDNQSGKSILKVDDAAENLVGTTFNAYMYKDGKYSRFLNQVSPMPFEGKAETFNDNDVEYWKGRAEKYFNDYVKPKLDSSEESTTEKSEATPF
jgi:hypothetical protein